MTTNTQLVESIFTLSRLMKEKMSYDSDLLHLSMLQLQTLVFISRHADCQMTEIATHFKIELPSATSLVTKLKSLQLITRKADKKDRRLVRIALTTKGQKLLTDALKERSKKMTQVLRQLTDEDKSILLNILQRLILRMEKNNEK